MKRKLEYHPSLFEAQPPTAQETLAKLEASSPPKIANPCPRCGARSLKTVRSYEHENHTHYCAGSCLSEDRTEAFYFTPRVETFDEQAAKEEAKKIVAAEVVVEAELPSLVTVQETLAALEELPAASPVVAETEGQPVDLFGVPIEKQRSGALAERFLVPPFSVLDARQGYWTKRKAEWVGMGISSEDGRIATNTPGIRCDGETGTKKFGKSSSPGRCFGQDLMRGEGNNFKKQKGVLHTANAGREDGEEFDGGDCWQGAGSSIFDPVLCELAYKWFAPVGGKILDPFAGGSVRGIVAEKLGYRYTGIELRTEQIAANQQQAAKIGVAPQWVLGDSSQMDTLVPVPAYEEMFDMVFACPPYYDLEEYSESAADGSAKQTYAEFLIWYKHIFGLCVKRLKWNRFLVIVVGEIRDDEGWYRNFVGDTVACMLSLGLRFYNEAILVTAVGSLPLRVNAQFGGYRKLGKTHQQCLVFYNGSNPDQIKEKFGELL